jgi:hypothetical protein
LLRQYVYALWTSFRWPCAHRPVISFTTSSLMLSVPQGASNRVILVAGALHRSVDVLAVSPAHMCLCLRSRVLPSIGPFSRPVATVGWAVRLGQSTTV